MIHSKRLAIILSLAAPLASLPAFAQAPSGPDTSQSKIVSEQQAQQQGTAGAQHSGHSEHGLKSGGLKSGPDKSKTRIISEDEARRQGTLGMQHGDNATIGAKSGPNKSNSKIISKQEARRQGTLGPSEGSNGQTGDGTAAGNESGSSGN